MWSFLTWSNPGPNMVHGPGFPNLGNLVHRTPVLGVRGDQTKFGLPPETKKTGKKLVQLSDQLPGDHLRRTA